MTPWNEILDFGLLQTRSKAWLLWLYNQVRVDKTQLNR